MRKDNRGITFVELIIVVAIMSILVGITGYGLGLISGKPAEECAQKTMFTIEQARTKALGKFQVTCELSRNASGMLQATETVIKAEGDTPQTTTTVIGDANVTVVCTLSTGTTVTISGTDKIKLCFNRATGGFEPEVIGGPLCEQITVSKGSTTRNIKLIPPTGKVYIE